MTVKELIDKLKKIDKTMEVIVEGCDCEAPAVGISIDEGRLVIKRENGVYSTGL